MNVSSQATEGTSLIKQNMGFPPCPFTPTSQNLSPWKESQFVFGERGWKTLINFQVLASMNLRTLLRNSKRQEQPQVHFVLPQEHICVRAANAQAPVSSTHIPFTQAKEKHCSYKSCTPNAIPSIHLQVSIPPENTVLEPCLKSPLWALTNGTAFFHKTLNKHKIKVNLAGSHFNEQTGW